MIGSELRAKTDVSVILTAERGHRKHCGNMDSVSKRWLRQLLLKYFKFISPAGMEWKHGSQQFTLQVRFVDSEIDLNWTPLYKTLKIKDKKIRNIPLC